MTASVRVGVVSDTHGLLRREALRALEGSDHIIHAGDIGTAAILDALREVAPVTAVRGNNDHGAWAEALPETALVELGGARLYVIHDVAALPVDPAGLGVAAVIAGHSHRPAATRRGDVLYLNPGSAGPRRFTLPIAVATLTVHAGAVRAELIELSC